MFEAFVYILRCSDGSYYVGSARGDLDHRISQHQGGEFGGYTSTRLAEALDVVATFCRL